MLALCSAPPLLSHPAVPNSDEAIRLGAPNARSVGVHQPNSAASRRRRSWRLRRSGRVMSALTSTQSTSRHSVVTRRSLRFVEQAAPRGRLPA
jgi:hypothetical protein